VPRESALGSKQIRAKSDVNGLGSQPCGTCRAGFNCQSSICQRRLRPAMPALHAGLRSEVAKIGAGYCADAETSWRHPGATRPGSARTKANCTPRLCSAMRGYCRWHARARNAGLGMTPARAADESYQRMGRHAPALLAQRRTAAGWHHPGATRPGSARTKAAALFAVRRKSVFVERAEIGGCSECRRKSVRLSRFGQVPAKGCSFSQGPEIICAGAQKKCFSLA